MQAVFDPLNTFASLTLPQMEIGKRIAQVREEKGLTQSGLARAMDVSQSAVSQIEAGERNPSYEMLRSIAAALGVSIPHLVGAPVEKLTPEEETHFRQYRGLSPEARKELQGFAAYLQQKQQQRKGK
jgi:transcriptional regulator with XRE-family HTH domain